MPYKDINVRRQKHREYCQRPEIKARRKEYAKSGYHKCLNCDKLVAPKAKRCQRCNIKYLHKNKLLKKTENGIKSISERMKKNNPMKNPKIAKKVRDLNKKRGNYEKVRIRMLNGGGKKAWDCMRKRGNICKEQKKTAILTKELLLKEYSINKKTIETIAKELGFCDKTISLRLKKFNIPLNKKAIPKCIDCGKIIYYTSQRCKSCSDKNRNKKIVWDKWKSFRQFITRMDHLEHLKKIGFQKEHKLTGQGRKFQKGHKMCVGEKHPNWRGGIQYEPYDDNFTPKFKETIRKRDNYTCLKCDKPEYKELQKSKRKLAVHHMNYDKKLTIKENCCTLCMACNMEVNYKRKHWTKFFQSLLAEKYNYQYSEDNLLIINLEINK